MSGYNPNNPLVITEQNNYILIVGFFVGFFCVYIYYKTQEQLKEDRLLNLKTKLHYINPYATDVLR